MPYIGRPLQAGVRRRYIYAATAGQTSFSGNDSSGISLAYDDNLFLDVYQNGVLLKPVTDYAATTGTSVVLTTGASTDDVLEMLVFDTFGVADTVSAKDGGSFAGAVSMASTLDVTGAITSSAGATITTADNTSQLTLTSTDADASAGPRLDLKRDSGSPADNDTVGRFRFLFDNDAAEETEAVRIDAFIPDVSDGTEDATFQTLTMVGGTMRSRVEHSSTETVFNQDSVDIDFRVESNGNTHAIFVDAGNGRIGINCDSPLNTDLQIGTNSGTLALGEAASGNGASLVKLQSSDTQKNWQIGTNNQVSGAFEISQSSSGGNTTFTGTPCFYLNNAGNLVLAFSLTVGGSVSKASGSFKIPHPLEAKKDTHYLVHSFVEGPQADNLYRGKVALVDGTATQNIDTVAGMTEGTFAALNREVQCFTTNETGWTAVKGSVSGNVLTITAQENTCTDTISWMVIGERKDQHMYDTDWTDDDGKVIVEPEVGSGADAPGPGAGG
jgi:hypothetical protein